jgi:hypothetical protein
LSSAWRLWQNGIVKWFEPGYRSAVVIGSIVLLAYSVLLPAGRWQGDEFFGASLIAQDRWRWLIAGLTWSPRPIGQPLGWLYILLSNTFNRPLIGIFLFLLWLGCFFLIALAARLTRRPAPISFAIVIFALTLLLSKPGEMFYWPVGAAAYLPCWVGMAGATILIGGSAKPGLALTSYFMLSALSLEVGSVTVLIFAFLLGAAALLDGRWRRLIPLAVPVLCSAIVCVTVLHGRIEPVQMTFDPSIGTGGNWLASLVAAVPAFVAEVVGITGLPWPIAAGVKLLLVGCWPRCNAAGVDRMALLLWACALLLAAFTSEVLGLEQFGALCCERHVTERQSMILLALVSLAELRPALPWLAPRLSHAALAFVLLALLSVRSGALFADWQRLPHAMSILRHNWKYALKQGDTMKWVTSLQSDVVNFDALPAGQYHLCSGDASCKVPWFAQGMMDRFHKQSLIITNSTP